MTDLYIIATIVAKPDKIETLRDALIPAVEAFRNEDGCTAYSLLEDRKRPGRFVTYERWRDQAALDAHMQSAMMKKIAPLLPDLLEGEMKQDFLEALLIL